MLHVIDKGGIGLLQSIIDLFFTCIFISEEQVISNGSKDKNWLLRYVSDCFSQSFQLDVLDVCRIEQDVSLQRLVKALNHLYYSALA